MIQRLVLVKLKDEYATPEARRSLSLKSQQILSQIPGVVGVSVGLPADAPTEGSWDISLVVNFQSLEHIPAYISHPDHRSYVDEWLKPKMEILKAWNFEIDHE